jgi:hypothetical protein
MLNFGRAAVNDIFPVIYDNVAVGALDAGPELSDNY